MKMFKLVIRLVGLIFLLLTFICAVGGFLIYSSGILNDLPSIALPDIPDREDIVAPSVDALPGSGTIGSLDELRNMDGDETVVLSTQVSQRPLLTRLPASPQEVSTDPAVVGTNTFLAIIMAIAFGVTNTVLDNLLEEEEDRIEAWIGAFGLNKPVQSLRNIVSSTGSKGLGGSLLSIPLIVLVLVGYGFIFALLEIETSLFSASGLVLAAQMTVAVAIVTFSGDLARRILSAIWGTRSSYRIYPVSMLTALVTVAVSRAFVLQPGIAFGVPGSSDVDIPPELEEKRERTLAFFSVLLVALVGALFWIGSSLISTVLNAPLNVDVALIVGSPLKVLQDVALLVFLIALESAFFDMMPALNTDGKTIFDWNPVAWAAMFLPTAFVFNHFLLNPTSDFLSSFQESNVRALWFILIVLIGVTGVLWFYFKFVDDLLQEWVGLKRKPRRRPPPPPAY